MPDPALRVAVVGARRVRQGTGEYVARAFASQGCSVVAIVGTTDATTRAAERELLERHGIRARGFLSLEALLRDEPVQVVAVCSPPERHLEAVRPALEAGCHVFCEKPFWWDDALPDAPEGQLEVALDGLLDLADRKGAHVAMNAQWPFTLEGYRQLWPGVLDGPVRTFEMTLSPFSTGLQMVVDSASHVISMLQALAGPGRVRDVAPSWTGERRLDLRFGWEGSRGRVEATLRLVHCPEPPRPAGYAIDGKAVERRITLPSYRLSFAAAGRNVPIRDPLEASVESFVRSVRSAARADRAVLTGGMIELRRLVVASRAQEMS